MWGNLHGWMISAALAVLILAPVAWLANLSRMSAPTGIGLDPANLQIMELPVSPDDVWPKEAPGADASSRSAADLYNKVIAGWDSDAEKKCEDFVRTPGDEIPDTLQLLIDAKDSPNVKMFSTDMPSLINYENEHPGLEKLFAAGEMAYKAGLSLHLHGKSAEVAPLIEAAFALGRQLWHERLVFDEFQKGAQLMADAAVAMCQIAPHSSPLYNRLSAFQRALNDYQTRSVIPMWQTISNVAPDVIAKSAGDILVVANQSHERMWRVEATLALGRYQYNAGTRGDQIGAGRAVRRLASDSDPAVAAAGAAARDLTIETYRMIH